MNYQNFGFNKNVSSSPNFLSDSDYNKAQNFTPIIPNTEEFSVLAQKRNEEFMKDTLSNIEEVGNHSFNSGQYRELLQSSGPKPKSHFLDDLSLPKQTSNLQMQYSYQNPQPFQNYQNYSQNFDAKSDVNVNINQNTNKNEDFLKILDSNDLSISDAKNKVNFNELTIQPDFETRSVFYDHEKPDNKLIKHGNYSMDMSKNQVLELELQKEVFFENNNNNQPNILGQYNTYSNNSISDKKLEKKNSYHHKGYSGDVGIYGNMPNFSLNNNDFGEKNKQEFSTNFITHSELEKKNQWEPKPDYQPMIKERTNFIDIFKTVPPKTQTPQPTHFYGNIESDFNEKKEGN